MLLQPLSKHCWFATHRSCVTTASNLLYLPTFNSCIFTGPQPYHLGPLPSLSAHAPPPHTTPSSTSKPSGNERSCNSDAVWAAMCLLGVSVSLKLFRKHLVPKLGDDSGGQLRDDSVHSPSSTLLCTQPTRISSLTDCVTWNARSNLLPCT